MTDAKRLTASLAPEWRAKISPAGLLLACAHLDLDLMQSLRYSCVDTCSTSRLQSAR